MKANNTVKRIDKHEESIKQIRDKAAEQN